jgi:hypothetical protein
VHDVAHARRGLAVHQQHAGDRRRPGGGVEAEQLAQLAADRKLLDLELGDLEPGAAPACQLAVGDELLEPLVECLGAGGPDVGAAALSADDLAGALQPSERRAQRPA